MAVLWFDGAQNGAINGGSVTLTFTSSALPNDLVLAFVTIGTSRSPTMGVASSDGAAMTLSLSSIQNSSNVQFGIFHRIIPAGATQAQIIASGTGGSTDSITCVGYILRNSSTAPYDATVTSTTGSGTTPDSPSITPSGNSQGMPLIAITAFGAGVNDVTVTPPSSWSAANIFGATDTHPSTTGVSQITYNSSAALNPASWSNLTSATWIAATLLVKSDFNAGAGIEVDSNPEDHVLWNRPEIVSY